MPHIVTRACPNGHQYDLLVTSRWDPERKVSVEEWSALDHDNIDFLDCPSCGAAAKVPVLTGFAIKTNSIHGLKRADYPRFDRGLGCWVQNADHHRWLMTHDEHGRPRSHKLIPMEEEWVPAEIISEEAAAIKEAEENFAMMQREMFNDPLVGDQYRSAQRYIDDCIARQDFSLWNQQSPIPEYSEANIAKALKEREYQVRHQRAALRGRRLIDADEG